jgi:curved DNA-binding protein CbpA
MTDYYNVLGVSEVADIKDIKKNYRELSLKWHPDKNKDPEAITKIQSINEAYSILGDEEKRRQYDEERRNPPCFQQQPCYQPQTNFPSGFSFSTNAPPNFFTPNVTQEQMREHFTNVFFKGMANSFGGNPNQNIFTEYKVHNNNGVFTTSFRMSNSK